MVAAVALATAVLSAILALAPAEASRSDDPLQRSHGPVFSLSASPRLGILLAGGADVVQPVGFGAGLQFSVHALHVGPVRVGGLLTLGHTRFLDRRTVAGNTDGGPTEVTRYAALGHTDFSAGPSFQIVMGPVFAELGFGAGLGISTLVRPVTPFKDDEQEFTDVTAMIRGGGHLGIPIRNRQSLIIGAGVHKYFSRLQVSAEVPPDPETQLPPDTNPFDLMVEVYLGYHFMF